MSDNSDDDMFESSKDMNFNSNMYGDEMLDESMIANDANDDDFNDWFDDEQDNEETFAVNAPESESSKPILNTSNKTEEKLSDKKEGPQDENVASPVTKRVRKSKKQSSVDVELPRPPVQVPVRLESIATRLCAADNALTETELALVADGLRGSLPPDNTRTLAHNGWPTHTLETLLHSAPTATSTHTHKILTVPARFLTGFTLGDKEYNTDGVAPVLRMLKTHCDRFHEAQRTAVAAEEAQSYVDANLSSLVASNNFAMSRGRGRGRQRTQTDRPGRGRGGRSNGRGGRNTGRGRGNGRGRGRGSFQNRV